MSALLTAMLVVFFHTAGFVLFFLAIGALVTVYLQIRCQHVWVFKRAIYGDEITHSGGKRTIWTCPGCERFKFTTDLLEPLTHAPYFYEGLYDDEIAAGGQAGKKAFDDLRNLVDASLQDALYRGYRVVLEGLPSAEHGNGAVNRIMAAALEVGRLCAKH